jgi:hypothetical protein
MAASAIEEPALAAGRRAATAERAQVASDLLAWDWWRIPDFPNRAFGLAPWHGLI